MASKRDEEEPNPTVRNIEIAQMMCAGASQAEIAERFKVHRTTIARLQETPEVLEEVERILSDARKAAKRAGSALVTKATKVWEDALGATSGAVCEDCGANLPDHAIRLRAADSVADRFGLPKTEVQELTGALTLGEKSDEELARVTLEEAIAILDEQGHHEAAAAVRGTLAI